jgi:diguanylate cyclase (GGDEF)-like protein
MIAAEQSLECGTWPQRSARPQRSPSDNRGWVTARLLLHNNLAHSTRLGYDADVGVDARGTEAAFTLATAVPPDFFCTVTVTEPDISTSSNRMLYTVIATLIFAFIALASTVLVRREFARREVEEMALRQRESRLRGAMYGSADGVFLLRAIRDDAGEVTDFELVDVNPTGASLMRQTPEALIGMRASTAAPLRCTGSQFADYVQTVETGTAMITEVRVSPRRFTTSWLWHQVVPVDGGVAVTIRDIAARKNEEEHLRRASVTDELTGLYNRRGFLTLAEQQLRLARRQGRDLVLFFADLDGFKQVNDHFGHAAGDRTLHAVASLLRDSVRDSDIVARLGGDEFTVLAVDGDASTAHAILRRINARIAHLNARHELAAPVSVSIGHVRIASTQTLSLDELLASADDRLYTRKAQRSVESVSSKVSTISSSDAPSSSLRHQGRPSSRRLDARTT